MPDLAQEQTKLLIEEQLAGITLNKEQIELIPFLIKKKYTADLVQHILAKSAYYNAVTALFALGLTQDIPTYFAHPDKLKELDYLDKVDDLSLKQLCLVFWVKGTLSYEEYEQIIKASATYPLLASTLIALDKTGEVAIGELKAWSLNPQKHLQESIIHHFSADFSVNKATLNKLAVHELERLSQSLVVLKNKKNAATEWYQVVARDNPQGQLVRLFLPSFAAQSNSDYRDTLIDLLYEGVHKGPISLAKQVFRINDDELKKEALKLSERFICAKQMQKLGFIDEIISFAADAKNEQANKLRYIILRVEAQCKKIHTRLLGGSTDLKQIHAWQSAEREYRKTLYALAYDVITEPDFNFMPHLQRAQNKVLTIIDPQTKYCIYNSLIIIANILIAAFTFGLANEYKYKQTRNFWFFNQSTSGEELRALQHDFTDLFRPKLG